MTRRRARLNGGDGGRIYVADLAAYNNGHLKGQWIAPSSDPDVLGDQIQDVLKAVKRKGHSVGEEWAIHDYDGFPDMGEYPGIQEVAKMAAVLEDPNADAVLALLKVEHRDPEEALEYVQENLAGVFKDAEQEFVDDLIDQGVIDEKTLLQHVDYASFGHDIRMDLDEEGEDSWAAEMSDQELGEHYADEGADSKTLLNYVDSGDVFNDFQQGGDINVYRFKGMDYVFWNR